MCLRAIFLLSAGAIVEWAFAIGTGVDSHNDGQLFAEIRAHDVQIASAGQYMRKQNDQIMRREDHRQNHTALPKARTDDEYIDKFKTIGCTNAGADLTWWKTQPDSIVLRDMYVYCSKTREGTASGAQRRQCVGISSSKPTSCKRETSFSKVCPSGRYKWTSYTGYYSEGAAGKVVTPFKTLDAAKNTCLKLGQACNAVTCTNLGESHGTNLGEHQGTCSVKAAAQLTQAPLDSQDHVKGSTTVTLQESSEVVTFLRTCIKDDEYELMPTKTVACPANLKITSQEECRTAYMEIKHSSKLQNANHAMVPGNWNGVPADCSLQHLKNPHWNAFTSRRRNSNARAKTGEFRPLCHQAQYELMPPHLALCFTGLRITTEEECEKAHDALKYILNFTKGAEEMNKGSWNGIPKECSLEVFQNPHFNTRLITNNSRVKTGEFRIMCLKANYQLMPPKVAVCPSGLSIADVNECYHAHAQVRDEFSLKKPDRAMVPGSWNGIPKDCSVQNLKDPHFNKRSSSSNSRVANGEFRMICRKAGHPATANPSTKVVPSDGYSYKRSGLGVAGSHEVWNVGNAKGRGAQACFEAVLGDSRCAKDYFTYNNRGDKNCGCKGSDAPIAIRTSATSDYYKIQAAIHKVATTQPPPNTVTQAPRGPVGPAGPVGLIGPAGYQGERGIEGPKGPVGWDGATGMQGLDGEQGETGETGALEQPPPPPGGLVTMPLVGALAAFNICGVAMVFYLLDKNARKKYKKEMMKDALEALGPNAEALALETALKTNRLEDFGELDDEEEEERSGRKKKRGGGGGGKTAVDKAIEKAAQKAIEKALK